MLCKHCGGPREKKTYPSGQTKWVCASCQKSRQDAWRVANPDKQFDHQLWTYYRIRSSQYFEMLKIQGNACSICGVDAEEARRRMKGGGTHRDFCVDHNHACCPGRRSCGKCVRGLICQHCNVALAMLNDSREHAEKLVQYLDKWESRVDHH